MAICPVDHYRNSRVRLMQVRVEETVLIKGREFKTGGWEMLCPVCEAEKIIRDYSKEAYPVK